MVSFKAYSFIACCSLGSLCVMNLIDIKEGNVTEDIDCCSRDC